MVVENGEIVARFEEPGINDEGKDEDPYVVSMPEKVLDWLRENRGERRKAA